MKESYPFYEMNQTGDGDLKLHIVIPSEYIKEIRNEFDYDFDAFMQVCSTFQQLCIAGSWGFIKHQMNNDSKIKEQRKKMQNALKIVLIHTINDYLSGDNLENYELCRECKNDD